MMRIYRNEHAEAFAKKERKYSDLVWYARSHPKGDTAYWEKVPDSIREGAFNAQARVQEMYPDEVSALSDDWNHGFNSGCLAAFRFIQTAIQEDVGTAEEEFPSLDT